MRHFSVLVEPAVYISYWILHSQCYRSTHGYIERIIDNTGIINTYVCGSEIQLYIIQCVCMYVFGILRLYYTIIYMYHFSFSWFEDRDRIDCKNFVKFENVILIMS